MRLSRSLASAFLLLATHCYATTDAIPTPPFEEGCVGPWFTGPLLAPAGHTIPPGYINLEPYFYYTVTTGLYDANWNSFSLPTFTTASFQMIFYLGLSKRWDIQISPQANWNATMGISSLEFADFPVQLDYQLIENESTPSIPAVKLSIRESFPTGRFDRLDPERFLTDAGGSGSYETTLGIVVTATHEFPTCHFFNWRLNGYVTLPTPVDVKGVSTYGGVADTDATIKPGTTFGAIFAIQYNFTENWAMAVDLEGLYQAKTSFNGFEGTEPADAPPPIVLGRPENFSFSLAPALEYNFNGNVGIIAGGWFTFAGKNTPRFWSAVLAINYFGPIKEGSARKFRTRGGSGGSAGGGGGR